jgi:hypothetical protein
VWELLQWLRLLFFGDSGEEVDARERATREEEEADEDDEDDEDDELA